MTLPSLVRSFRSVLSMPSALVASVLLVSASSSLLGCDDSSSTSSTPTPEPKPVLVEENLAPQVDALLDELVAAGFVGVGVFVERQGHKPYESTRGLANVETLEPLSTDHVFRYASMSKPYLSALIVKLATEGRLSMADVITKYLPASITDLIPDADKITIYDLVSMWSGIHDYRDDTYTQILLSDPTKVRNEYEDLIEGLTRNPKACAVPEIPLADVTPEIAECLYSNSNFILLGYIADKVLYGIDPSPTGNARHHSEAFQENFFAPLGLTTYYEKHLLAGRTPVGQLPHSYITLPDANGKPTLTDVSTWDDGQGFANGGLVGSMTDLARFRRALFDGTNAFPMRTLAEKARFLDAYTTANPLGVAPGGFANAEYWKSAGDIGGYTSWAEYAPTRETTIIFYSNDRDAEGAKVDIIAELESLLASENE